MTDFDRGFSGECEEESRARNSLLQHYSLEVTAHGTFILTVILALLAFAQGSQYIPFSGLVHNLIISLILGILFMILTVAVGRLVFWGYMATIVLYVMPMSEKEFGKVRERFMSSEPVRFNVLTSLACACYARAKEYPYFPVRMFARTSLGLASVAFLFWFVIFTLMSNIHL